MKDMKTGIEKMPFNLKENNVTSDKQANLAHTEKRGQKRNKKIQTKLFQQRILDLIDQYAITVHLEDLNVQR